MRKRQPRDTVIRDSLIDSFCYLPLEDILRSERVSKEWQRAARSNKVWTVQCEKLWHDKVETFRTKYRWCWYHAAAWAKSVMLIIVNKINLQDKDQSQRTCNSLIYWDNPLSSSSSSSIAHNGRGVVHIFQSIQQKWCTSIILIVFYWDRQRWARFFMFYHKAVPFTMFSIVLVIIIYIRNMCRTPSESWKKGVQGKHTYSRSKIQIGNGWHLRNLQLSNGAFDLKRARAATGCRSIPTGLMTIKALKSLRQSFESLRRMVPWSASTTWRLCACLSPRFLLLLRMMMTIMRWRTLPLPPLPPLHRRLLLPVSCGRSKKQRQTGWWSVFRSITFPATSPRGIQRTGGS